jgi:tetratricopeptide (TPR) repeat protein
MKHIFSILAVSVLLMTSASAQEYKKQLKSANKTLAKYYLDPVTNKADLSAAFGILDGVFADEVAKADPEAWVTKGQIYNEIAKGEMSRKIVDPAYELATPDAGMIALEAFQKAMTLAIKKSQTKDALAGIRENEDYTSNIGITMFQAQNYNGAFKNFNAGLTANKILKENIQDSRLDDVPTKQDHIFYTAVSGYFGEFKKESLPLFEELYKSGKAEPIVYEALFNQASENKEIDKAMRYLEEGRKANPDDNSLLFAEINYYLKEGKLDVLTTKLKDAIAKEPSNVTVYTTLGNVYDQLNQQERAAGNTAKADEYFGLAFEYFKQSLAIDPKNFDAVYSQGALYYNKAASMTTQLNALGNDYSAAGTKKYNAVKAEMDGYFKDAMPYFQQAETLNPNDVNTMIALKEIYARTGDLNKSNEYKKKIAALEGGN